MLYYITYLVTMAMQGHLLLHR